MRWTEIIIQQLTEGAWGTDVRCGIIGEIGCSWPLTPFEERSLRAAAKSPGQDRCSDYCPSGRHPEAPTQILDILEEAGADLSRTIMDHIGAHLYRSRTMSSDWYAAAVLRNMISLVSSSRNIGSASPICPPTGCASTISGGSLKLALTQMSSFRRIYAPALTAPILWRHGYGHIDHECYPADARSWLQSRRHQSCADRDPARLLSPV